MPIPFLAQNGKHKRNRGSMLAAAAAAPLHSRLAASFSLYSSNGSRLWRQPGVHHRTSDGAVKKRASPVLQARSDVAISDDTDDGTSRLQAAAVVNHHQLLVREPNVGEFWEVADIQCTCFFPDTKFPLDLMLRSDRVMAMLGNFAIPPGLKRRSLVAVECQLDGDRGGGLDQGGCSVSGAATVDTLADFLPRRKPFARRRTGVAYLSNVAVRPRRRRRGIARQLVREAEHIARAWGCRSIALHCDMNNAAAANLYLAEGYRVVRVPTGAVWPQPNALPGSDFQLLLKVLH